MSITHKTAVITGISSGIGLALTKKLLTEGYRVIGTTRTGSINGLKHEQLQLVSLDITDDDSLKTAANNIIKLASSDIDLLINNAGIAPDVFAVKPEPVSFTQTIATNLTGTVFFTEALIEHLNSNAQVIFISSNMALPRNAAANGPGYRLSKAAINMYAAMLAERLKTSGIRVTPMHPGWVKTKLGGNSAPFTTEQSADALYRGISTNTQTGKFWNADTHSIEEY
ncbi:SDR family NAD(P)-dependent oxidoreductase [Mucilaginibacter lutimaris]|uniref:SDR family NAD(P)-dependent oxidoreductase n=1 Tax=Mucilaginibacter lutimaris TaxID=931629 RepID=A0ABW2ZKA7_9SPHI